ncbi:outer membrane lipoprotein carrier protein LolA [Sphingobium sufflavum]|nr:outer membrane lipoprotein carrier protein LolA [Sphingobium sufflavum]MCE7798574.1 outer membrane lipoprotein carrier protein LolA [Sphingobium sufflavum]
MPGGPPSLVAPAQAQTGQPADLALVQRHLRAITTLTAQFSQTDRNGQVQNGQLSWKQPGHIRFQYAAPNPLLIVADGKSLYMIDYEVRQVQRWPIRNSPLGALLDPTRDLSRYGKLIQTGDPSVVSMEVRDPDHAEYGVINMVFQRDAQAPAGLRLYGWVARDAQGNRTSIKLSGTSYGAPIPDSAFRWKDPRPAQRGAGR